MQQKVIVVERFSASKKLEEITPRKPLNSTTSKKTKKPVVSVNKQKFSDMKIPKKEIRLFKVPQKSSRKVPASRDSSENRSLYALKSPNKPNYQSNSTETNELRNLEKEFDSALSDITIKTI